MLEKFKKIFSTDSCNYEAIFANNVNMLINGDVKFSGIAEVQCHYEKLKNGLSQIDFAITKIIYKTAEKINFIWRIKAKHTGIFMNFLPTKKNIEYSGMTTLHINNLKITELYVFFDEKKLEEQISATVEKIFIPEEIFNNLTGPAHKIYRFLLSTRQTLTDSKQALINALRKTTIVAPNMELLDHTMLGELRTKTSLLKHTINVKDRSIDLFIYTPKGQEHNEKLPTILYLHGGGWCIGSPEGYDIPNRKLALVTNARVICPRYRLCPEHPYPAGFDDCYDVYLQLRNFSANSEIAINSKKIYIAGDSVGGGFAAALTLRLKDEQQILPDKLILLSPATDMRLENYPSYNQYTRNNLMIDQALIGFIRGAYIQGDMWDHPYLSPLRGDLSSFPRTFVMIGEDDPLYDENMALVDKISRTSKHQCEVLIGKGMPHHYHTFVGLADAVEEAYQKISLFINTM